MKKLYSEEESNNAKHFDKLPLKCEFCNNVFYTTKKYLNRTLIIHKNKSYSRTADFCSVKCAKKFKNKDNSFNVNCLNCNKEFKKNKFEYLKSPNHFCSSSCAATYNNTHKQTGTKISKLEVWLKEQLTIQYPDLEIHYNRKDAINSELDIYIPSLKLAFELNGIFHYEPIYGAEKLQQIQNNDDRKFQACLEKGIELVIIDISSQKYFKEKTSKKYLEIILEIINIKSV